ncbi:MAG: nitronate monooxygenase [Chloroflexi bacterium]|nr:nitronate monooxygenase [Chloroflexota bacterium]
MLRTPLCDLLGIEYPILQAGMGHVASGDMAAAVSNAGGLGTIGGGPLSIDELRAEIRKVKQRAWDKPFAVDLVFPARGPEHATAVQLPERLPEPLYQVRKELEERGAKILELAQEPAMMQELMRQKVAVIIEERATALVSGLGTPEWAIKEVHAAGLKYISIVGNLRNAKRVEAMGADIIVAQGTEGGGHTGRITTFTLVPQVVDAVKVPVVAAGGIATGAQIIAALALGAVGVWIGTRFIATRESWASDAYKQKVVEAAAEDAVWSKAYDGLGHRHIKNRYMEIWEDHEHEALPFPQQFIASAPLFEAARRHDLVDYQWLSAGQSAAFVKELQGAGDVVRLLVAEAEAAMKRNLTSGLQVS